MIIIYIISALLIWFGIGILVARHEYKQGVKNHNDIMNIVGLGPLALLHVVFRWICDLAMRGM